MLLRSGNMTGKKNKGGTSRKGANPNLGSKMNNPISNQVGTSSSGEIPAEQPSDVELTDSDTHPVLRSGYSDSEHTEKGNQNVVIVSPVKLDGSPSKVRFMLPNKEVAGSGIEHIEEQEITSNEVNDEVHGSYVSKLLGDMKPQVNFRFLEPVDSMEDVDVVLPKESVQVVQRRFANTLFGYFLGKRLAYPVVENFVKNAWAKYGLQRIMMNSNGFFFFKFASKQGMQSVLENGPWLIRNVPIFLNIWSPTAVLKKEDIKTVAVWVKVHNVPMVAYTEDGLSMLASKLGTPKLLDTYTSSMCMESWGRSSYARALIEISAENDLKEELTMAIPNLEGEGFVKETMEVEYEWKPPRCENCKVFGHEVGQCPKLEQLIKKPIAVADGFQEVKKKKKVNQHIGLNMNKQKPKMIYQPVVKPTRYTGEVSTSKATIISKNSFELLNDCEVTMNEVNGIKKVKKPGYSTSSKPHLSPDYTDDFDDDVDEHIEIPLETSAT